MRAVARRFRNLDPAHRPNSAGAVFRWAIADRLLGRRRPGPDGPPAPRVEPDLALVRRRDGPPRATWIGHASFLLTLGGAHVLVDPALQDRIAGFLKRGVPATPGPADLPRPDVLLVTHAHYDHLDAPSVEALPREIPVAAPLGLGRWFRRRGFRDVREMGWWDATEAASLRVTFVPARHWSRRTPLDTNRSWWGGYVVEGGGVAVYHAGDSAWFDGFAEIGRRFPGLAAALLPVGAYAPAWFMEEHHMNPEQAGRAFLETGARLLVPMHWGAFRLADEPLSEPPERLRRWWAANAPPDGRRLHVPAVGETLDLGTFLSHLQ